MSSSVAGCVLCHLSRRTGGTGPRSQSSLARTTASVRAHASYLVFRAGGAVGARACASSAAGPQPPRLWACTRHFDQTPSVRGDRRTKTVVQLDSSTSEVLRTFPSMKVALASLGKNPKSGNIYDACEGRKSTAYGFRWPSLATMMSSTQTQRRQRAAWTRATTRRRPSSRTRENENAASTTFTTANSARRPSRRRQPAAAWPCRSVQGVTSARDRGSRTRDPATARPREQYLAKRPKYDLSTVPFGSCTRRRRRRREDRASQKHLFQCTSTGNTRTTGSCRASTRSTATLHASSARWSTRTIRRGRKWSRCDPSTARCGRLTQVRRRRAPSESRSRALMGSMAASKGSNREPGVDPINGFVVARTKRAADGGDGPVSLA